MRTTTYRLILAATVSIVAACADASTAPETPAALTGATSPVPPENGSTTGAIPSPASIDLPRLAGGGFVTEYILHGRPGPLDTVHDTGTSVLASNGAMVITKNGRCCQILGDTALQINYDGLITVGSFEMKRIRIDFPDEEYGFGASDILLMIKDGERRMLFFVPTKPPTLEILSFTRPVGDRIGSIHGRITFEAAGYLQKRSLFSSTVTVTKLEGTTMVKAEFVSPMRYQLHEWTFDP